MSTLRADASKKPQDYVRQLKVGGHDVVEDQWRGETDSVTQVLLNNQVAMNPSLVVTESVTLAGSLNEQITVGKAVGTLLGVLCFTASGIQDVTATAWTPDGDQVANPGVIDATGTPAAGVALVHYLAA
jgi:hypothetical protein